VVAATINGRSQQSAPLAFGRRGATVSPTARSASRTARGAPAFAACSSFTPGKTYQTGIEHAIHADSPEMDILEMRRSPRGGFVGIARLVDCVDVSLNVDGSRAGPDRDYISDAIAPDQRIWTGGPFAFVLDDVRALPEVVPYRGELGFFNVSDPSLAAIDAMLRKRTGAAQRCRRAPYSQKVDAQL
jgi:hypothetical protein